MGLSKQATDIVTNVALGVANKLLSNGANEEQVIDVFRNLHQRAERLHIKAEEFDAEVEDALDSKFGPKG